MQALVIVGHGSHLNPGSSDPAFAHADTIREAGAFDEVREAFWKEEPSFREVLRTLESGEVFVVPLFVAEGYFTEQVIPRELRLDGWNAESWSSDGTDADHVTLDAADVGKTVHYCGPVGTHDSMSDVIVQRARSVTGDPNVGFADGSLSSDPGTESDDEPRSSAAQAGSGGGFGLAVVGHGTERNENSAKATHYHADRIRGSGGFEEVRAVFMDEEPAVDDVAELFGADDIVVVPLFVADGFHTQEDIPEDVGLTSDAMDGYPVPGEVGGHRIWYSGAVGTEPLVADVILERASDAGADVADAVDRVRERTGGVESAGPEGSRSEREARGSTATREGD